MIETNEIVQTKNYYPFGMEHKYGKYSPLSSINGLNNKRGFNGQELNEYLGLNLKEMTYRQYDNALGRFHSIDKMAKASFSVNPYHFTGNKPINYSDASGLLRQAPNEYNYSPVDYSVFNGTKNRGHWSDSVNRGFYSGGSGVFENKIKV